MKTNKYSINGLLQLTLTFSVFLSVVNSTSIQVKASDASGKNREDDQPVKVKDNSEYIKEQLTKIENNINDLNNSFSDKLDESLNKQNYFSLQDSLIYINLPIAVILLLMWFLNQNQRKKQMNRLITKQNHIEKRLIELKENNLTQNDIKNIERKIIKQFQENNQKITDSKIEILGTLHKNQVHQPVNYHNNLDDYSNNYSSSLASTTEQVEHQLDTPSYNSVAVIEHIPQFVETYNLEKNSLADNAIATVVATEESLNKRRLGDEGKLTLENTTQKKYLIVQEDSDFYLVPHAKIKIDEYNITTLEALFECISFTPEYRDFHLIQPAKVSQLNSELWQLDRKGKLEFS